MWAEVSVEDRDGVTPCVSQAPRKGPGLEALTVSAMQDFNVHPSRAVERCSLNCQTRRFVRRIVQDLDLKALPWVIKRSHCIYDAVDDMPLVVDGHLDGHRR
jgi:hypothetical protein